MKRARFGLLFLPLILALGGCNDNDYVWVEDDYPAPPLNLNGWYYNQAVYLTWELGAGWNNDPFRVYGKRISDSGYFMIDKKFF